jgi:hypothetical protein
VVVANIFLSKSKKTVKIISTEGCLIGIARRSELNDLLAEKLSHVNVCLFQDSPFQEPLGELKPVNPDALSFVVKPFRTSEA